LQNTRRI